MKGKTKGARQLIYLRFSIVDLDYRVGLFGYAQGRLYRPPRNDSGAML
jgi:hypothetical protein